MILPAAQSDGFKVDIDKDVGPLQYAKVYMKLGELIQGEFFNQYIKSGESSPLILRMLDLTLCRKHINDLSWQTWPRQRLFALRGHPTSRSRQSNVRAHGTEWHCDSEWRQKACKSEILLATIFARSKYVMLTVNPAIELNLRLPSMVHGKHGFERIVWAFRNVLNHSVTWLFYSLSGKNNGSGPIAEHQPKIVTVKSEIDTLNRARIPKPTQEIGDEDHDLANDLLEWLSLTTMGSPRVQQKDSIDSYLSKYRVPGEDEDMECTTQDLTILRWHGLIPATFIKGAVLAVLKAPDTEWFGMNAVGFDGRPYSILQRKHHTLTWEYED